MLKPIFLVLGPSGVGKSFLSEILESKGFLYLHIDTDSPERSFKANGFPAEWDNDFRQVEFDKMVVILRNKLIEEQIGTIISFPTSYLLTYEMLIKAINVGMTPLLLWGTREHCMNSANERIKKKGKTFNQNRYDKWNNPTFLTYSIPDFDDFRVEAFRDDGSRYPEEEWLAEIMQKLSNNSGLNLQ